MQRLTDYFHTNSLRFDTRVSLILFKEGSHESNFNQTNPQQTPILFRRLRGGRTERQLDSETVEQ